MLPLMSLIKFKDRKKIKPQTTKELIKKLFN